MVRESPGPEIVCGSPDQKWIARLRVDLGNRITIGCDLQMHRSLYASFLYERWNLNGFMVCDVGGRDRGLILMNRTHLWIRLGRALGCPFASLAPVVEEDAFDFFTGPLSNHRKLQPLAKFVLNPCVKAEHVTINVRLADFPFLALRSCGVAIELRFKSAIGPQSKGCAYCSLCVSDLSVPFLRKSVATDPASRTRSDFNYPRLLQKCPGEVQDTEFEGYIESPRHMVYEFPLPDTIFRALNEKRMPFFNSHVGDDMAVRSHAQANLSLNARLSCQGRI